MTSSPPDRLPAADAYRIAVEEYRFQAQFNWSRTQYWLVSNSRLLAAGVAVLAATRGVFAVIVSAGGLIACALPVRAIQVTHECYRRARNRVRAVEDELGLEPPQRLDTTGGLAEPRMRVRVRVNAAQLTYLLLAVQAAGNVAGLITSAVIR